jgi:G protein-coupled receptor Mth (Methuselah protein)
MIHFVLPQLRDLVGNIITTMSVCLIVAQSADLVRIFTEFKIHSPLSFLIAGKLNKSILIVIIAYLKCTH